MFLKVCFLYFIYCIIGWIWESIYESIRNKKVINRGFLNGPYIPIYGFGGWFIYFVLQRFEAPILSITTLLLFLGGAIGATILEYITSYVLEKTLKARWWDYSDYPLNVNGRICLIATVFWGVITVVAVDFLNPALLRLHDSIPRDGVLIFVTVMTTLFAVDLAVTINSILDLQNRIKLFMSLEKDKVVEKFADRKEDLIKYRDRLGQIGNPFTKRIILAFPRLKFTSDKNQKIFERIKRFALRKPKDKE